MPPASGVPGAARDMLKRVKRIEITTRTLVNHVFSGAYHSIFKGQGMEFSEVRPYHRGDDVRTIAWHVSARTGHLHVKRYHEERELTVMLAVDTSASTLFGSGHQNKAELAAEISALLAFSALKNNDRVGLLMFSDRCEKFVPPKKGRKHGLRVITEILTHQPQARGTNLNCALEFLSRALRRRSIIFMLSDFFAPDFTTALKIAKRKHDCVALVLNDRRELEFPDLGRMRVADSETGEEVEIDTHRPEDRNAYAGLSRARARARREFFISQQVDAVDLFTNSSYTQALMNFFRQRLKRIRA